jgi:hypothetical protein
MVLALRRRGGEIAEAAAYVLPEVQGQTRIPPSPLLSGG